MLEVPRVWRSQWGAGDVCDGAKGYPGEGCEDVKGYTAVGYSQLKAEGISWVWVSSHGIFGRS